MTMPADRARDRRGFQELAKMASGLTPPPASVSSGQLAPMSGVMRAPEAQKSGMKDDSGIVDLAAASTADPGAAVRAQSTPLASQGLFDEEPASIRPPMSGHGPMSTPMQPAPSIPPMPASLAPASLAPQHSLTPSAPAVGYAQPLASVHPLPTKKKGNGAVIALVFGGLVALSGAAAGGFFYMKSHKAPAAEPVATQPAVATPAQTAAAPVDPTPAPTETVAVVDPTPAPEEKTTAKPNAGAKVAFAPKGGAPAVAPPAAKDPGPAKMTEKDLAAAPTGPAGDLGAAMQKEVGPKDQKPAAAQTGGGGATGNVPQKPSQGAVTGAIGAVLPQARGCLGPDDPISRASIVFGSEGGVQSVTVSGAAAGKPAEACIKGALTKAKVAPFAEASYTANITIRHN